MKKMNFKQFLFITLGVLLIAISYYFMFLPLNLVTGGVTGISVILNYLITSPYFKVSYVIYGLNAVLLIVGGIFLGKDFFIKTIFGSLLLPTVIFIFEVCNISPESLFSIDEKFFGLPAMSETARFLIAIIFGGAMMGFGLGICYKNNGSTGGMDVIQKILSKYTHLPYSLTVYFTDGALVLLSFFVFGLERTVIAFLIILLVGNVADYVEIGGKLRRTVFIISKENEQIKKFIIDNLERGVTVSRVTGGYSNEDFPMLISTLNKKESYVLRDFIMSVDPSAFTFYVSAKEVYGDGFE